MTNELDIDGKVISYKISEGSNDACITLLKQCGIFAVNQAFLNEDRSIEYLVYAPFEAYRNNPKAGHRLISARDIVEILVKGETNEQ